MQSLNHKPEVDHYAEAARMFAELKMMVIRLDHLSMEMKSQMKKIENHLHGRSSG